MTYRNQSVATIGLVSVVVAYDINLGEYRCRLIVDRVAHPDADYFTDDKDDARHTAWAMARATAQPT